MEEKSDRKFVSTVISIPSVIAVSMVVRLSVCFQFRKLSHYLYKNKLQRKEFFFSANLTFKLKNMCDNSILTQFI